MSQRYYDNTRLDSARECLRKYYFRHVRHWRRDGSAPALAFGLSWHDAMDVIWQGLCGRENPDINEVHANAMVAWHARWTSEGFPSWNDMTLDQEQQMAPRTPGIAAEMLHAYIEERRGFLSNTELIACEKPFCVPLHPDDTSILYVGRRDKDFKHPQGGIYTGEHKTTSAYLKNGPFRRDYVDSWSPNSQIDGYIHSGHMDYGQKQRAVWVDAALVHKTVRGFKFIPIERDHSHLDSWLWETADLINEIEENAEVLKTMRAAGIANEVQFLPAFRKNTYSCQGKFGPCSYRDICKFYTNPEQISEPPDGFIHDRWEPFKILDLAKIGLKEEE